MKKILGIDEAGRGAVIGPLVICGVLADKKKIKKLKKIKVKDSKLIEPERRVFLSTKIKEIVESFEIIRIRAREIDRAREIGISLNDIEAERMAYIINNFKPEEVYIDAVDRNVNKFNSRLNKFLRVNTKIISEHDADKNYAIVSAASIIAKVERDISVEELKSIYGDFGSGYPADEKTKNFLIRLVKNKNIPNIVRKSWETIEEIKGKEKQRTLEEFLNGK